MHAGIGAPVRPSTLGPTCENGSAGREPWSSSFIFGARAIIGGRLENRPANLIRWISNPQAVAPGTAMPNLNVKPADARDIAAFLYTNS